MDSVLRFRKLRGRHFLTDLDYTREELEDLLALAVSLKALWRRRPLTPFLPGRHLAMIFEAASTRTRVSFENGFAELGGTALYLRPGEIHLPGRESIADTARTLSQYNAAIEIRAKSNETVNELAAWSTVPVINGMDHDRHPCQSMSDAFTILEHAGIAARRHLRLRRRRRPSLQLALDDAHQARPERTRRQRSRLRDRCRACGANADRFAAESGGSFLLTNDPLEAIAGADFIYTDCWWWTGQEDEYADRVAAFKPFQVNADTVEPHETRRQVHALPAGHARRGGHRRDRRRRRRRSSSRRHRTGCTSRRR